MRFRSKERGTRVKDRAKNVSFLISRAAKAENPVPRSFFAPKPNGNACYAGQVVASGGSSVRLCYKMMTLLLLLLGVTCVLVRRGMNLAALQSGLKEYAEKQRR